MAMSELDALYRRQQMEYEREKLRNMMYSGYGSVPEPEVKKPEEPKTNPVLLLLEDL